jgi:hypothetical protein
VLLLQNLGFGNGESTSYRGGEGGSTLVSASVSAFCLFSAFGHFEEMCMIPVSHCMTLWDKGDMKYVIQ